MQFEWDENKNQENIEKHGLSFEEAQEAFYDKKRIVRDDKKHSQYEKRFFCIGRVSNRIAIVRYTVRNGNIRIIGAGYWRYGRNKYEQKNNF